MRRTHKHESRPKSKRDIFEFDLYDDYDGGLDDVLDSLSDLAEDFYSTEWKDPSRPKRKISARRQIEKRNELKDLESEFDGWDDIGRNYGCWD